jgi:hypothetical protein
MTLEISLKIREWLSRYLDGEISLRQFEDWFIPVAWGIPRTANQGTLELVGEIELRLAEFSNGHWTEPELRTTLEPLVTFYKTEVTSENLHNSGKYSFQSSLTLPSPHVG